MLLPIGLPQTSVVTGDSGRVRLWPESRADNPSTPPPGI